MKKAGWFPAHTKAARVCWYESHWLIDSCSRLRYWTGTSGCSMTNNAPGRTTPSAG